MSVQAHRDLLEYRCDEVRAAVLALLSPHFGSSSRSILAALEDGRISPCGCGLRPDHAAELAILASALRNLEAAISLLRDPH